MVSFHEVQEGVSGKAELGIGAADDGFDGLEEAGIDLRRGGVGGLLD